MVLPRDAGPHNGLTEWWYFTGHLRSERDGRAYGFEFTVFQARRQGAPTGYLAHFAISDIASQHFSHQSRSAQSDTSGSGFPIDVDGWRLSSNGAADVIEAEMLPGPGAEPPFGLRLRTLDEKPPALHHGGYIDYGPAGGSYYYSRTRLLVTGELTQPSGERVPVSGLAWMDHQWGNFVVTATGGWDWYSLQLDDRTELMLYVLRGPNGETTGVYGTQVQADGQVIELPAASVHTQATATWQSPHTSALYPSGWQLTLPDGTRLDVEPLLQDQELYFPEAPSLGVLPYWEGAVRVTGDRTGVGYVELTGYARR
jgi:predicted secreted hydrolase